MWIFPIRLVPENDVKKPSMFVFKDMEDYRVRGKNVDAVYSAGLMKKKAPGKSAQMIRHKKFGVGTVIERKGKFIIVQFGKVGRKQLNEKVCVEKGLIEEV